MNVHQKEFEREPEVHDDQEKTEKSFQIDESYLKTQVAEAMSIFTSPLLGVASAITGKNIGGTGLALAALRLIFRGW